MTSADRLAELSEHGVSVWLDSLSRGRLRGGGLAALVRDRHVVGVTTKPTIFEQAVAGSSDYASQVQDLGLRGVSPEEAARSMIGYDVPWACGVLRPCSTGLVASTAAFQSKSILGSLTTRREPLQKPGHCSGSSPDPT
jgi:hypothetical protein